MVADATDAGLAVDDIPPEDVPPLEDDDDVACAVLVLSPETAFDAGADVVTCVPGRSTACRCEGGGAGIQACDSHGRMGECWCIDRPVVRTPASTETGIVVYPGASTTLPARLVRPLSGMRVMSQRPMLRWELPAGMTRARVELCDDRACTRSIASVEVMGTSWRSPTVLRPGVVFWRVSGLRADGSVGWTSATWEFGVRHRDTPIDTIGGPLKDFDGDGYDDALVIQEGRGFLLRGSPRGANRRPEPQFVGSLRSLGRPAGVGDFNGDGLGDVALSDSEFVGMPSGFPDEYIRILYGDYGCPVREGGTLRTPVYGVDLGTGRGVAAGDFDGDGFADIISAGVNHLGLYPGGAQGVDLHPESLIRVEGSGWFGYGTSTRMVGDVDGDGYADIAIGNRGALDGTGQVQVFYGNPARRLEIRVQTITNPEGGEFGRALMGGDFNGDGFSDLLVARRGAFYVYRGSPAGITFAQRILNTIGPAFGAVGDLNGDGLVEVVGYDDYQMIYESHGATGFSDAPDVLIGSPSPGSSVRGEISSPGDMDSDGYDDLIAATYGNNPLGYWFHLYQGRAIIFEAPYMTWWSSSSATSIE